MSSERSGPVNDAVGYDVKIAGQPFKSGGDESNGMTTLVIEDHVDMIGVAHATIGFVNQAWKAYKQGTDFEVTLSGSSKPLFKGHVTEVRYSFAKARKEITVVALDPQVKLMASRTTKVYEKMKDSEIASAVISRAGCTAGTVDATSAKSDYTFQRNEPDLFFLKRLAARNNYLLTATEGKVNFQSVQFTGDLITVALDEVIRLDWGASTMSLPPDVTVYGWDYVTKEKVTGKASSGDVKLIGGGKNAASETGQLWQKTSYISDVLVSSNPGALEMAKAEYNRLARGYLKGVAVIQGNAKIRAGVRVKFKDHAEGWNAEGYVVSSRHTVDEQGFLTEFHFIGNTQPA